MNARVAVLRRVLGSRVLRRVELAFLGFSCAEHAVWVAMLVYAYQRGGTAEAAGIAVAQLLPAAVVAPLASRLTDRRGGGTGLWVGYVAQALGMGATAVLLLSDAPALAVYAGAIFAASAVTLTRPAQSALLPELVDEPAELTAANAVTGWLESVSVFAGPGLAGLLIAITGPGAVFAVFAAAAVASALLVAPLARRSRGGRSDTEDTTTAERPLAVLREHPGALGLMVVIAIQFVAYGAFDVLVVVMAIELVGLGAAGAGYLNAAFGIGGILGGIGTLWLVGRDRLVPPLLGAVTAWGGAFVLIGVWPTVAGAFILLAAAGSAWTLLDVAARTLMQRAMPAGVRGRVFGMVEGMSMLALALGSALVPILAALGGARAAVAGTGVLLIVAGGAVIGRLRGLDGSTAPAGRELELLRSSPMFGVLAADVLEGLAQSLAPVRVPPGTAVVRQGEAGDRFYLVAEGRMAVTVDGRQVGVLEPGDGFGEIALLRDGVRTSTVEAIEPALVYELERAPFLEALTGHPGARQAAESLADERLRAHA